MAYIHKTTRDYPVTEQQIRSAHPATIFPVPFEPTEDYAWVNETAPPAHNPDTHRAVQIEPVHDGDDWRQAWTIEPLTPGEIDVALQSLKAQLAAAVTAKRWAVETGGIEFPDGTRIATAVEDQNRITTVVANAQLAGVESVDFKAATGWVTLTLAEVQGIAAAIAIHVQGCFSVERSHHAAIEGLTTLEQARTYDVGAGWPA